MLDKIVAMLGASPIQYRLLLKIEKLVERRALEGRNDLSHAALAMTCIFSFAISAVFMAIPFLTHIDTFTYTLIGVTMSMAMISIWTVPYFDILLAPINYPVIAHTPVSSRTYFLVKLTQLLTPTILLLGCLNLMPAIGGIWIRSSESSQFQFFFPLVYLPITFMSGFFTIGVMTTFAGYLTKLYSKRTLRSIAQYAQFIVPALLPVTWILLSRLLPDMSKAQLASVLKWIYALPNGWFAGTVSLMLGEIELRFLISAGLTVISTLFLVFVPLRSIAQRYSMYLSYLLESRSQQKAKIRVKTPLFARMFRNRTIRAGFCLCAAYMRRDRTLLKQLFAALGSVLMLIVMFEQGWMRHAFAIGLSPGFSIMFYFVGISLVGCFISPIRYSEHWKASWILTLAPLRTPNDLWRGAQATAFVYMVAPCTLLMLCIAIVFWGVLGIFYVLPIVIILINFVVLYPKPPSRLPLAIELVQNQAAGELFVPFLLSILVVGVFVGIQFLTYLLNISVYYGFYSITVVGGLISCVYFLKQNASRKI